MINRIWVQIYKGSGLKSILTQLEISLIFIKNEIDIFMISETKIDNSFSIFQFTMKGCSIPFRLDWISYGGKIPLFVTENISCKIIKTVYNVDFREFLWS